MEPQKGHIKPILKCAMTDQVALRAFWVGLDYFFMTTNHKAISRKEILFKKTTKVLEIEMLNKKIAEFATFV